MDRNFSRGKANPHYLRTGPTVPSIVCFICCTTSSLYLLRTSSYPLDVSPATSSTSIARWKSPFPLSARARWIWALTRSGLSLMACLRRENSFSGSTYLLFLREEPLVILAVGSSGKQYNFNYNISSNVFNSISNFNKGGSN